MTRSNANANRSASIDVTDPSAAKALAAAWRGVEQFFDGQVTNWEITPATEDAPEGTLHAMGFSIRGDVGVTPETLVADLSGRERRLEFLPFYLYVQGNRSEAYSDPQDMTNWGTLYLKGTVESGTSKVPAYARAAVAAYKTAQGIATRRGPKRKVVNLTDINSIDPKEIPADQIEALLALAAKVAGSQGVTAEVATA